LYKAIFISFIVFVTGCSSTEKIIKYSATVKCFHENKPVHREITSNVRLTNEEIQFLIPTIENKFGYQPGSCRPT